MFCSSPIIEKIGVNKKKTMMLLVFCFLISLMISYWFYNSTSHGLYWLERVVRYFPAYILGFAIAKYGDIIKFEKYDKKKYSMIAAHFTRNVDVQTLAVRHKITRSAIYQDFKTLKDILLVVAAQKGLVTIEPNKAQDEQEGEKQDA